MNTISSSLDVNKVKELMIISKMYANTFSDDPTAKIGAIFIDSDYQILSIGCNHSPYQIHLNSNNERNTLLSNTINELTKQKTKYAWIEHAERNAIFNAEKNGVSLKDSICITTLVPCIECTRAIISVGVKEIFTFIPCGPSVWADAFKVSTKLLNKAHIPVNIIKINNNDVKNIDLGKYGWESKKLYTDDKCDEQISGGKRYRKTRKNKI